MTYNYSSAKGIIEFILISYDYFDFLSSNTCMMIKMMIIEILQRSNESRSLASPQRKSIQGPSARNKKENSCNRFFDAHNIE